MSDNLILQLASLLALIIAITTHEAAHGYMAKAFGDRTAEHMGRLTLNPIAHIDPFGTILLPALLFFMGSPFLFGWAKPVPVNVRNLIPRRPGEFMVAIAGPGTNFIIAIFSALLLHLNPEGKTFGNNLLIQLIFINIMLGVFNMLPFLPLDGGRALNALLPPRLAHYFSKTEAYWIFILLPLALIPVYNGQTVFSLILLPLVKIVYIAILTLTGNS